MKRTWVKVIAIVVALALCGAGAAFAQKAKKPEKEFDIGKALLDSYDLIEKKQYKKADALLDTILEKDPEPVSAVQPTAPLALDYCIRTCLAKAA